MYPSPFWIYLISPLTVTGLFCSGWDETTNITNDRSMILKRELQVWYINSTGTKRPQCTCMCVYVCQLVNTCWTSLWLDSGKQSNRGKIMFWPKLYFILLVTLPSTLRNHKYSSCTWKWFLKIYFLTALKRWGGIRNQFNKCSNEYISHTVSGFA